MWKKWLITVFSATMLWFPSVARADVQPITIAHVSAAAQTIQLTTLTSSTYSDGPVLQAISSRSGSTYHSGFRSPSSSVRGSYGGSSYGSSYGGYGGYGGYGSRSTFGGFGSHLASFGAGMFLGSMIHPFGYGYGGYYHPFSFGGLFVDLILFWIVISILRKIFR